MFLVLFMFFFFLSLIFFFAKVDLKQISLSLELNELNEVYSSSLNQASYPRLPGVSLPSPFTKPLHPPHRQHNHTTTVPHAQPHNHCATCINTEPLLEHQTNLRDIQIHNGTKHNKTVSKGIHSNAQISCMFEGSTD